MKTFWIILVIVLVVIAGYLGRHRIKAMLGMTPTPPPTQQTMMPSSPQPSSMAASSSAGITMTETSPTKGKYLTDTKGMALYTFDKDKPGVSNCNGACVSIWPPFKVSDKSTSTPAGFSVFTRDDGSAQYAYKDMPLYYYAKDTKAGDTLGDGVNGTWHLAKP